jgi:hypothetical protein
LLKVRGEGAQRIDWSSARACRHSLPWLLCHSSRPLSRRPPACLLARPPALRAVAPGVYAIKWSDQVRARAPFSTEWYVLSDELNPKALKPQGSAYNDISAAGGSALDTLLTGRCAAAGCCGCGWTCKPLSR